MSRPSTPEELFTGHPLGLELYRTVADAIAAIAAEERAEEQGGEPVEIRPTVSQIAFRRRHGFAYVWRPGQYLSSPVPAVLSIALPRKLASRRFKQVAHPSNRVWMHHLELHAVADVDDEVRGWLRDAFAAAGGGKPAG